MNRALVCGAGGFIGSHLVKRLKAEGCWVRGVDQKLPEFGSTAADEFRLLDLRERNQAEVAVGLDGAHFDEVYQLAADMGGMGYRLNNKRVKLWWREDRAIWGLPESGVVEYSRA